MGYPSANAVEKVHTKLVQFYLAEGYQRPEAEQMARDGWADILAEARQVRGFTAADVREHWRKYGVVVKGTPREVGRIIAQVIAFWTRSYAVRRRAVNRVLSGDERAVDDVVEAIVT